MNRFGTRLGLFLYWMLLITGLLLLLAALVGVLVLGLGLFSPESLADAASGRDAAAIATPGAAVAVGAIIIGAATLAGVIVTQLIGLMRSAADGAPFVARNVTRLRVIAGAIAVGVVAKLAGSLLAPDHFGTLMEGEASVITLAQDLGGALVALVLAEVFRAGIALSEDVEGTV